MEGLHDDDDEPTGNPVTQFDFDYEIYSLNVDELK